MVALPLVLFLGCSGPDATTPPDTDEPQVLGSVALLTRASLDLRGVRPSAEDVAAVLADPAAADPLIEGYLQDERFGSRVASLFSSVYLTRADESDIADAEYALADETAFLAAMGEEPLRILGAIAAEDLPYTDIVRADWTMADDMLASRYPVDYPDGETGWKKVHYTDGRPTAGILSASGMWWRYSTTAGNANRGRANAVSRILLCQDYLDRTIEVDPTLDLLDEDAVEEALRTNEGCVACHYSLDPLGSYFWGFYVEFSLDVTDLSWYHPDREYLWEVYGGGIAPGYHGEPGADIDDLGLKIAQDPRLVECLVERSRELLLQRPTTLEDTTALSLHREDLLAGGVTVRSLFRSIVASPAYRLAPGGADADAVPWKMVSADQYVTQLEDLTGFRFTAGGYDVMDYDLFGLRTLAGGGRAVYGTSASADPTPTLVVVQQRLAEAAAWSVAASDHAEPATARLFTRIDFTETPSAGRDAMVDQVRFLYLRVLGKDVPADSAAVTTALALWEELFAADADAEAAWAGVLTVMFRDPDFVIY